MYNLLILNVTCVYNTIVFDIVIAIVITIGMHFSGEPISKNKGFVYIFFKNNTDFMEMFYFIELMGSHIQVLDLARCLTIGFAPNILIDF